MSNKTELLTKVRDFLLDLSEKICLVSFYIGKSEDVAKRELQHQGEGYCKSIEIAHSSSPYKIDEAERFLIDYFKEKNTKMPIAFDNENNGGGGNPKANKLYVSLRLKMKSDSDLWDDEDENFIFESIKL